MKSSAPASRGRALDLLHRRVGIGERDVLAHGVGEQERVLEHDADRADRNESTDRSRTSTPSSRTRPRVDVVEARDEARDGGLAAAGRADERDRLAAADREVEPSSTARPGP